MSNELIVAVVPSETFMFTKPVVWDEDKKESVPVESLVSRAEWSILEGDRAAIAKRFPGAYYALRMPVDSVWEQPAEKNLRDPIAGPPSKRLKEARRAHQAAVRASLDAFLNEKLRRLDQMVRTGWWILAEARVRVSRFRGMP
jgi:hypothetical protein